MFYLSKHNLIIIIINTIIIIINAIIIIIILHHHQQDEKLVAAFREHQKGASRLSMADEVRTLIEQSIGYGVISTNSVAFPDYPTGSVVGFALEDDGRPFFVFRYFILQSLLLISSLILLSNVHYAINITADTQLLVSH
jgi:hypothetical protein